MANPYYNYDGAFIPGQLARAEAVAAEFQSVQSGFSLLSYYGTDSGVANAYVITTGGSPTGAYSDGQIIQFKATNTCTGASTVTANGLPVVPLTRFDGSSTQSNDVLAEAFYTAQYDATNSKFRITSPAAYTTNSSTVSFAVPTHKVGLVAAGGVSTAVTPIDATFALDQSIAPTWTGAHTFSIAATFSAGATFGASSTFSAGATFTVPVAPSSGGTGLSTYTVGDILYASGTGTLARLADVATGSFLRSGGVGVAPAWGSLVAGDISGLSVTWAGTETFTNAITVNGAGSSLKGGVSVTAPASGTALAVSGLSFNPTASLTSTGASSPFIIGWNTGVGTAWSLFSQVGDPLLVGTAGAAAFSLLTNSATRVSIGSAGNIAVNAPGSGVTLTLSGNTGAETILVSAGGNTGPMMTFDAGGALGSYFRYRANSADVAYMGSGSRVFSGAVSDFGITAVGANKLQLGTNSLSRLEINGVGGVTVNAPTTTTSAAGGSSFNVFAPSAAGASFGMFVQAGTNASDYALLINNQANTLNFFEVKGNGLAYAIDDGGTLQLLGWRGTPINVPGANYTLALSDRGKTVRSASVGLTFTVPANVFSAGDVVTLIQDSGGTLTVAQGASVTLHWAGTGSTTGSRTLTGQGLCTLLFTSATDAVIAGAGLS